MLVHANNDNFLELVNEGIVLVDFYADWCGPCKMLSPIMEELSTSYKVVKVNVDENDALAREYGIMSIPAIFIFKDGKVVNQTVGFLPKEKLKAMLDNVK